MNEPGGDALGRQSGAELTRRLGRRWAVIEAGATVLGVFVVVTFLDAFHEVGASEHSDEVAVALYLAIGLPARWLWRERRSRAVWRWLRDDRAPDGRERVLALREPLRQAAVQAAFWGVGAVLFAGLMVSVSVEHAVEMALAIVLGGVTTCALTYLLVERLLRPVTARALAGAPSVPGVVCRAGRWPASMWGVEQPERPVGPCIEARLITAWVLASGVPLLGLVLLALRAVSGRLENQNPDALAVLVLILAGAGLAAGAVAAVLSARSLADPLGAVRRALARVRAGDLDAQVAVDDASEVGLLQAGFNDMAAGLRERERLRDLFGRHVGEEVARRALAEGVSLGGEVREIAALFIDIVGSTALAATRPPEVVVSQLNRFFTVVIDVVEGHGGWVNKFEGDGALCVFGTPAAQPDMAGQALAAARVLRQRYQEELPELDAGIGVSAGLAVAGNVGSERRLEYTVVGDPVNEAARLCELAKSQPARVLASATILAKTSTDEAARWHLGDETTLRGRSAPTRLATPVGDRAHEEASLC